jgi:hypothetical protein
MNDVLAVLFLVLITSGVAVLLQRNHRRTAGLPRLPYGLDLERDTDLWRLRHDLDVARPAH